MPPAICPFASPSISNAPSNSCSSRLKLGRAAPARKSEVFHFLPNSLHLARTGHKQRLVSVVTIQCDPLSLKKLASAFPVAVAVRAKTSSYNSGTAFDYSKMQVSARGDHEVFQTWIERGSMFKRQGPFIGSALRSVRTDNEVLPRRTESWSTPPKEAISSILAS
jgi:hypothetical protein